MPDTRRLFFALWPTAELRERVAARMTAMTHIPCRVMTPGNLHVTLAFLGAVPATRLPDLVALGRRLQFTPCEISFDRLAIWKKARVLVLTASQVPDPLQLFAAQLRTELSETGLHVDDRPFRPHVTLARDVGAPPCDVATAPLVWPARDFVLVESVATENGVQYRPLTT